MVYPDGKGMGYGVAEEQLHIATGLRNRTHQVAISTNFFGVTISTPIGTASGGVSGSGTNFWGTGLRAAGSVWNPILPVPMTPTVTVFHETSAIPGGLQFQLRLRGTDQFGNPIEDVSPLIGKTVSTTDYISSITMSKVFATVDEAWIWTVGVINTTSVLGIGWSTIIDPLFSGLAPTSVPITNPAAFQARMTVLNAGATGTIWANQNTYPNWGVGTPVRVQAFGPAQPFATPELIGGTGILLREKTTPTVINAVARFPGKNQPFTGGVASAVGLTFGQSVAGWRGTPHKIGFYSNDFWTTKLGIGLGGSSTRAAGRPTTQAQVGEDELMLLFWLRTSIGSQRLSNTATSYPRG